MAPGLDSIHSQRKKKSYVPSPNVVEAFSNHTRTETDPKDSIDCCMIVVVGKQ